MDIRTDILLGLAGAFGLGAGLRGALRYVRRAKLLRITEEVTLAHARLLLVKQKQLVIHDGYGNYRLEGWIAHANYFIDNVVLREIRRRGLDPGPMPKGSPHRVLITRKFLSVLHGQDVAALPAHTEAFLPPGRNYEAQCFDILDAQGWVVATTPITGDQGADLIASAGRHRVVIQCKFHARPIGNKAVQEAFAAKAFHAGDYAAVVSNSAFTRSAQQLAAVNGVVLLHHDQLPDLATLLGLPQPKRGSASQPLSAPGRSGRRKTE